jgi:hypothetical protein
VQQPGGIYEYTLENASRTEPPSLERRAAALGAALIGRPGAAPRPGQRPRGGGKGQRRAQAGGLAAPGLAPGALRLLLFGELVSGAGFDRDRLYVEWRVTFDPAIWQLQGVDAARQQGGADGNQGAVGMIQVGGRLHDGC